MKKTAIVQPFCQCIHWCECWVARSYLPALTSSSCHSTSFRPNSFANLSEQFEALDWSVQVVEMVLQRLEAMQCPIVCLQNRLDGVPFGSVQVFAALFGPCRQNKALLNIGVGLTLIQQTPLQFTRLFSLCFGFRGVIPKRENVLCKK